MAFRECFRRAFWAGSSRARCFSSCVAVIGGGFGAVGFGRDHGASVLISVEWNAYWHKALERCSPFAFLGRVSISNSSGLRSGGKPLGAAGERWATTGAAGDFDLFMRILFRHAGLVLGGVANRGIPDASRDHSADGIIGWYTNFDGLRIGNWRGFGGLCG